jgi:hypothetical protein
MLLILHPKKRTLIELLADKTWQMWGWWVLSLTSLKAA